MKTSVGAGKFFGRTLESPGEGPDASGGFRPFHSHEATAQVSGGSENYLREVVRPDQHNKTLCTSAAACWARSGL